MPDSSATTAPPSIDSGASPAQVAVVVSGEPVLRRGRKHGGLLPATDITHSGMTIPRFVGMHVLGALFPITAGILLYGWRAFVAIALVCFAAVGATVVWQHIGQRGCRLRVDHSLWLALLLALTL